MSPCTNSFERFAERFLVTANEPCAREAFRSIAHYNALERDGSLDFGESGQQLAYVVSGSTKLVAHASESRDQIIAFHFAGDIFCIPARDNYSYSVSALRDCRLLTFPAAEFLALSRSEPEILRLLLDNMTQSLRRCREKAIALGRKTAGERIAVFLLAMAERIGAEQGGVTTLDLPMSRRDIAESLGLTIETVSRQLSLLRDAGLIRTAGRSMVTLLDHERLRAHAGYLREAA